MANITKIEPRWNHGFANDPEIVITLDDDISKSMEWIYEPIPFNAVLENVMLLSTNNEPWVRFAYIADPKGSPSKHGALGGSYNLIDGTVFKTRTGWSSRDGIINRDYFEYLTDEVVGVTLKFPSWRIGFAGYTISHKYLANHPLWPKDCYLIRTLKFDDEPYWNISSTTRIITKPPKTVTPPTQTLRG